MNNSNKTYYFLEKVDAPLYYLKEEVKKKFQSMDRLNQIDQNIDPLDILTGSIEVNVRFLGIRG